MARFTRLAHLNKARTVAKYAEMVTAMPLPDDIATQRARQTAVEALHNLFVLLRDTAPKKARKTRDFNGIPTYEVEKAVNPGTCSFRCPCCSAIHTHSLPAERDVPERREALCYLDRAPRHPLGYYIVWRGK